MDTLRVATEVSLVFRRWTIVPEQFVKGTANRPLMRGIKSRLMAALQTTERMTSVGVSLSNHVVRQLMVHDEHAAILGRSVIAQCEDTSLSSTMLPSNNHLNK